MALTLDTLRIKAPVSLSTAEADKLRAALEPGQAPILPIQLQATYGDGALQIQYGLFVLAQNLQITTFSGVVQTAQQQPIGLQSTAVGNHGSTGGWGGLWALSGIDAYAGQTLTVIIGGEYSINGASAQSFGPFQTTVQIPK
jgi:hypothetical protein